MVTLKHCDWCMDIMRERFDERRIQIWTDGDGNSFEYEICHGCMNDAVVVLRKLMEGKKNDRS